AGTSVNADTVAGIGQAGGAGRVEADVVTGDRVVARATPADTDAGARVAADDVAAAGAVVADQVVLGARCDLDARLSVAHGRRPARIGADVVAPDAVGVSPVQQHPQAVARDDVAGRRRRAADQVARRPPGDEHAEQLAAEAGRAGGVGAEVVAG